MTATRALAPFAALALLAALAAPAGAQQPAFDMNGTGNAASQPAPAAPFQVAPPPGQYPPASASPQPAPFGMPAPSAGGSAAPAVPGAAPFGMTPGVAPGTAQNLPAGTPPALATPTPPGGAPPASADAPFQMRPGQPAAPLATPGTMRPAAATAAPKGPDRFIVPLAKLVLEGEVDSRAWVTYMTEEEAARPATFMLGYLNALVVMPEASRLRVTINGQSILETPIASSQTPAHLAVPIRPGILRAGANLMRIDVVQRHRTDCTVSATYELWTQIDNATTGISFNGGRPVITGGLDDLPAIGVGERGATSIRVVTPGPLEGGGSARVLRAVQGIAIRGRFPNPVVTIAEGAQGPAPAGTLTLVLGTSTELPRLMGSPPAEAQMRPVTRFIADSRLGGPTLVVSGPSGSDVDTAIERLNAITIAPRDALMTASRFAPDAPLFNGARTIRLADVGIATQEFSGRRFRTRFGIGLPPDFYASAYAQATLMLDAAYTAAVRPGSHVDVYVNGQIASTLAIASRGGGLFQRELIKIPMHNFRPGLNRIWLEVILDTEADARCLPGATLPGDDRFVLFDSTEFSIGDFARIGRTPDIAALTASAFPYDRNDGPLAVVLARQDAPTVSSAGTLMARLALAATQPIPIDAAPASATLGERNAIFVGGIGQIATGILAQVGIAETTRVNWLAGPGDEGAPRAPGASAGYDDVLERFRNRQNPQGSGSASPQPGGDAQSETPEVYERWRDNLQGGGGIGGVLTGFEGWMKRTFDISYSSLRIGRAEQTMFEPPARTSVLLAQGSSPGNNGTWTLVSGRTPESLANGLASLTSGEVWNRLGGQAVAYQASTDTIEKRDITWYRFIVTQPLGFSNFRMVASNWLSINIVPYALMLVVCGIVLGTATAFMLRRLGRTS